MVIAQFWAFANDLYTPEQGKRLFPLIGVGSSLGAWVGSVRAGQIVDDARHRAPARGRRRHPRDLRVPGAAGQPRAPARRGRARGRGRRREAARPAKAASR